MKFPRSTLLVLVAAASSACADPEMPAPKPEMHEPMASEQDASARAPEMPNTNVPCQVPEPPPIVMKTSSGEQRGGPGSYCASGPGCNLCADRWLAPRESTVVHEGDEIVFSMPEGTLRDGGDACMPACPPTLRILVQDCKGQYHDVERVLLVEDKPWQVSLAAGQYTLVADAHFTGDNGSAGGTSANFGLIVDKQRERGRAEPPGRIEDCSKRIVDFVSDVDAGM